MSVKPTLNEISLSNDMIIEAVADYEREHPGLDGWRMPPEEFSSRIMEKMMGSLRIIEGGNA